MIHLPESPDELQQLLRDAVSEAIEGMDRDRLRVDGRLAYTEIEAAELIGLRRHQLRDCRLRGEVEASRVGRRVLYSRDQLLQLLEANRE